MTQYTDDGGIMPQSGIQKTKIGCRTYRYIWRAHPPTDIQW